MQNLYERHKLLSYQRTDSRYLTTDIVATLPDRLKSIAVGPYQIAARNINPTSKGIQLIGLVPQDLKSPYCGKYLLEVNGKKGKMLVCSDRDCGYRKGVAQVSNARCPTCHKKMEIRGDGDSKIFVCGCGYREKLSAFNKRRDSEKSGLDKIVTPKAIAISLV